MPKIIVNILDDDPVIPDFIKQLFNDEYEVLCFYTPQDFHAQFSRNVALFITDVRIPGYDVLSTIKTVSAINPSCYIIVISAHFDVEILKKFIECRVDGVVEKGADIKWIDELGTIVNRLRPKIKARP